jgi:hypothetical protein
VDHQSDGSRAGVEPIPSHVTRHEERSVPRTELPIREGIVSVIHARTRAQIERTQIVRSWPHRTRASQADNARGTGAVSSIDQTIRRTRLG